MVWYPTSSNLGSYWNFYFAIDFLKEYGLKILPFNIMPAIAQSVERTAAFLSNQEAAGSNLTWDNFFFWFCVFLESRSIFHHILLRIFFYIIISNKYAPKKEAAWQNAPKCYGARKCLNHETFPKVGDIKLRFDNLKFVQWSNNLNDYNNLDSMYEQLTAFMTN